jgi:hypothetical protein
MSPKILSALCCVSVVAFASTAMSDNVLKVAPAVHWTGKNVANEATNSPDAPVTIFTNLGTDPLNLYNALEGGYYVAGPTNTVPNLGVSQWMALPFKTRAAAVHATRLQAAIGWIQGVKQVRLSIYTDAGGVVGTSLGGAQTANIPDLGVCCALATVNIAAPGIALAANTSYWLVATSTNGAPDFAGAWQSSVNTNIGGNVDNTGWFTFSSLWPAGKITGTQP